MEFDNHFYAEVEEKSTEVHAFELLVNRWTGSIVPEPGPNMMWNTKYGHMGAGMMGRRGGQGTAQGDGLLHTYMVAAFAEAFDMTPEALQAELDAGKRMYDIAVTEGYTADQFTELMITTRATALEQAVAAGTITQEQADWMLQRWDTRQANGYGAGNCPMRTAPAIP